MALPYLKTDQRLYAALSQRCNGSDPVRVNLTTLAEEIGMTYRTICRAAARLEQNEFIVRERPPDSRALLYQVLE